MYFNFIYISFLKEAIPAVLERLTDEELKSDARVNESKTDTMSCLIRGCRNLATKATQNPNLSKGLFSNYLFFIEFR